ncbi:hypothetical protein PTKIN_Ptkin10aG0022200 [Pterospermum kingtungense]
MVSNIIACVYAAISTLIVLGTRYAKTGLSPIVFDLVMVALLYSANGAGLAIGLIAFKGNSHVQWNKASNIFDKFCEQTAVSLVLSAIASLAFVALVAFAALTLHSRFGRRI